MTKDVVNLCSRESLVRILLVCGAHPCARDGWDPERYKLAWYVIMINIIVDRVQAQAWHNKVCSIAKKSNCVMKKFTLTNLFLKALDLKFNPSGSTLLIESLMSSRLNFILDCASIGRIVDVGLLHFPDYMSFVKSEWVILSRERCEVEADGYLVLVPSFDENLWYGSQFLLAVGCERILDMGYVAAAVDIDN